RRTAARSRARNQISAPSRRWIVSASERRPMGSASHDLTSSQENRSCWVSNPAQGLGRGPVDRGGVDSQASTGGRGSAPEADEPPAADEGLTLARPSLQQRKDQKGRRPMRRVGRSFPL